MEPLSLETSSFISSLHEGIQGSCFEPGYMHCWTDVVCHVRLCSHLHDDPRLAVRGFAKVDLVRWQDMSEANPVLDVIRSTGQLF